MTADAATGGLDSLLGYIADITAFVILPAIYMLYRMIAEVRDSLSERLYREIVDVKESLNTRMGELDSRLSRIEGKFEIIERMVAEAHSYGGRLQALEARVKGLEERDPQGGEGG